MDKLSDQTYIEHILLRRQKAPGSCQGMNGFLGRSADIRRRRIVGAPNPDGAVGAGRGASQAAAEIESFVQGMAFEEFAEDIKTQRAVARDFEIIGEASKRLSEDLKAKIEQLPWRKIAGMRDVLVHDYMDIDLDIIWKASTEDIKELKGILGKKSE